MSRRTTSICPIMEMAQDLEMLYGIVNAASNDGTVICSDASGLLSAASSCRGMVGQDRWSYDAEVKFSVPKFQRAYPANLKEIFLTMHVNVEGRANSNIPPEDPLYVLEFNIMLFGIAGKPPQTNHHAAWHLDRHDVEPDDDDGEPGDIHPRYHIQFGGREMWDKSKYFGVGMVMSTPRLVHPPLDAILGVDFVLSNFRGSDWHFLRKENSDYRDIQARAQRRLWLPYINSLSACGLKSPPAKTWHYSDAWPSLMTLPVLDP